jgi:hypothetical protein
MKPLRIPLRIIFYKEDGDWIAHCLEFNLLGHGQNKRAALKMLANAIRVQIRATVKYNNPKNLISFADEEFFQMFAAGKDVAIGKLEISPVASVTIEEVAAREYLDEPEEADADLTTAQISFD